MAHDYRQLMQQQLDGELDEQSVAELYHHLQADYQAAEEHAQLEQVHDFLAKAPMLRAPQRLAATIMARLATQLEKKAAQQPLPEEVRLALLLGTSMVSMVMMPAMLAASYMVLNRASNPALLSRVIQRTIGLQVLMIDALVILLDEVERRIHEDPESAPVALALIPVALQGMLDSMELVDALNSSHPSD